MMAHAKRAPGQHLRFEYLPGPRAVQFSVVQGGPLPARLQECLAASRADGAQPDGVADIQAGAGQEGAAAEPAAKRMRTADGPA